MPLTPSQIRLAQLLRRYSIRTSDTPTFKLASGRMSDFFCDLKPTLGQPEGAFLIAKLMLRQLRKTPSDFAAGLELGAPLITSALTSLSFAVNQPQRTLVVRKKPKDHGTAELIECLPQGESLEGRTVSVIEDVTTTGDSALKAVNVFRDAGAHVVQVITVLDREEEDGLAAKTFAGENIPFHALLTRAQTMAVDIER